MSFNLVEGTIVYDIDSNPKFLGNLQKVCLSGTVDISQCFRSYDDVTGSVESDPSLSTTYLDHISGSALEKVFIEQIVEQVLEETRINTAIHGGVRSRIYAIDVAPKTKTPAVFIELTQLKNLQLLMRNGSKKWTKEKDKVETDLEEITVQKLIFTVQLCVGQDDTNWGGLEKYQKSFESQTSTPQKLKDIPEAQLSGLTLTRMEFNLQQVCLPGTLFFIHIFSYLEFCSFNHN
mgnify:CR=1 FL=1